MMQHGKCLFLLCPPSFNGKQELKRRILGIDPTQVSLFFPPDVPTSCRMLLAQLFVRDPKHRLGARKQDVPLIKAHALLLTTDDSRLTEPWAHLV